MAAIGFDLQQTGDLHTRAQEDRIKYLLPGVPWGLASLRQSVHETRESKHLIEVSLEAVPGQAY
jgi:hypothetical protein